MAALDTPQRKAQSDGLALAPRVLAMRIDFAHASEEHLVVYGWVIGLSESVASAMLSVGDILVDLLTDAVRVKRVDVTQNFRDQVRESDEHGFLALIEARQLRAVQTLRLMVSLKTGASAENEWPIIRDEAIGAATLRAHEGALRPLIPLLTLRQKQVLASLGSRPPLSLRADDLRRSESDAVVSLPLHIQLCCLLPGGVLIVGGVLPRPQNEIRALALLCESERVDLLEGFVKVNDPSATPEAARGAGASAYLPCAFLSAIKLPGAAAALKDARIEFSSVLGNATARPAVRVEPDEARARFNAHLASVDPGTRLELSERITTLLAQDAEFLQLPELAGSHLSAAVSELQGHLDEHGPEHDLRFYLDRTIRVADIGVFVIGWAQAGPKAKLAITCHGQGAEFAVDERWIRWPRPDVEKHLATLGVAVAEDPGFICFIPIRAGGVPHYLKIRDGSGKVWRIRLPSPASETPMQAIRAVLSTVDVSRADLRLLLDDHVGPAVSALWAAHTPTRQRAVVERFGPQPEAPEYRSWSLSMGATTLWIFSSLCSRTIRTSNRPN